MSVVGWVIGIVVGLIVIGIIIRIANSGQEESLETQISGFRKFLDACCKRFRFWK